MKRLLTYFIPLMLVMFTVAATAQDAQEQQERTSRRGFRQPMTARRMGMRGQNMGMNMMNRTPLRGDVGRDRQQAAGPMRGSDDFYLNLRGVLDLTDDQVRELRELRVEHIKTTGDIETDLTVARLELRDLLDSDTPKMNAIEDKIGDIHNLEAQLETARLRVRFDAKAVLTAEQVEQIQAAPRGRNVMRGTPGPRS